MRRFIMGAIIGAALVHFYIQRGVSLLESGEQRIDTVGSQYRGDTHRRMADDALR